MKKPPPDWTQTRDTKPVVELVEGDSYLYFDGPRVIMRVMGEDAEGLLRFAVGLPGRSGPRYWGIHKFTPDQIVILA